jgi:hypothetical protein
MKSGSGSLDGSRIDASSTSSLSPKRDMKKTNRLSGTWVRSTPCSGTVTCIPRKPLDSARVVLDLSSEGRTRHISRQKTVSYFGCGSTVSENRNRWGGSRHRESSRFRGGVSTTRPSVDLGRVSGAMLNWNIAWKTFGTRIDGAFVF